MVVVCRSESTGSATKSPKSKPGDLGSTRRVESSHPDKWKSRQRRDFYLFAWHGKGSIVRRLDRAFQFLNKCEITIGHAERAEVSEVVVQSSRPLKTSRLAGFFNGLGTLERNYWFRRGLAYIS